MSDEPSPLHEVLAALGASRAEVDEAERTGTLLALAADRFLLPGERRYRAAELGALSGADPESLVKLFLALGLPQPEADKVFSDYDVEVIRTFVRDGNAELTEYSLHEARVISASLGRVAEVFVDEVWDHHLGAGQSDRQALGELAPTLDFGRVEQMLLYLLRRQIVTAMYRRAALRDQTKRLGTASLAVGFADLADFSVLSRDMSDSELTALVVAFEKAAYDMAAGLGARVVKTLGDGVMFTAEEAAAAARFGLSLASIGDELPPVRVGVAWGPVLLRQGDCFGPTVNLVSRIVGCAGAGEVVVDGPMRDALAGDASFATAALGARELKSFGMVDLWRLGFES